MEGGTYVTSLKPITNYGAENFVCIISHKSKTEYNAALFKKLNTLQLTNIFTYKVLRTFFDRSGDKNGALGPRTLS